MIKIIRYVLAPVLMLSISNAAHGPSGDGELDEYKTIH